MDSGRIRLSITDRRSKNPRARSNPQSAGGVTRRPHGTITPCGAYAARLVHYPTEPMPLLVSVISRIKRARNSTLFLSWLWDCR